MKPFCRWDVINWASLWLTGMCLKRLGWEWRVPRAGPTLVNSYTSCLHALGGKLWPPPKEEPTEGFLTGSHSSTVPFSTWFLQPAFISSQKLRRFLKEIMGRQRRLGLCVHPWASHKNSSGFLMVCVPLPMWALEIPQTPWCLISASLKKRISSRNNKLWQIHQFHNILIADFVAYANRSPLSRKVTLVW